MTITVHRGSAEIGGNCVEVATANTRLIVDVGVPLSEFGSGDRSESDSTRVLPGVPGLFSSGPRVDAILLSHAHADHTGLVNEAKPDIPVYLSTGTSKIMQAGSIFAGQPKLSRDRCRTIDVGTPFAIGDLRITAFNVDHSTFDCLAFLIEGNGKCLLYSGDLRMHGRKPGMARRILSELSGKSIDALIMEGTNISRSAESVVSESELETQIRLAIEKSSELVLAAFSPQHVDRLVSFYRATKQSGRTFVVDVYGAWILHLISGQARVPKAETRNGIRVYYPMHFENTWERRNLGKVHDKFMESRITLEEVLGHPAEHVMMFRPSMLRMDFEGSTPPDSHCIYSYWDGYLDREDWSQTRGAFHGSNRGFSILHTSGHIFADDAVRFVKALGAKKVVPIHSETPGRYADLVENVRLVNDGEPMSL